MSTVDKHASFANVGRSLLYTIFAKLAAIR